MKDRIESIFVGLCLCLSIGGITGVAMWANKKTCEVRWRDAGTVSEWRFGAGCLVKRKDGSWVPEKVLRDVSL